MRPWKTPDDWPALPSSQSWTNHWFILIIKTHKDIISIQTASRNINLQTKLFVSSLPSTFSPYTLTHTETSFRSVWASLSPFGMAPLSLSAWSCQEADGFWLCGRIPHMLVPASYRIRPEAPLDPSVTVNPRREKSCRYSVKTSTTRGVDLVWLQFYL